ncbi:MAG TPA: hypothetical protein VGD78_05295 [Chthoniobacterales bacterium]
MNATEQHFSLRPFGRQYKFFAGKLPSIPEIHRDEQRQTATDNDEKGELMKSAAITGLAWFGMIILVSAQDTAYKALKAVGTQRGEKSLTRILSISGRSGHPQPLDWSVLVDDASARGGVREFDVVAGEISAERTPVKTSLPKPIDLASLNVDSDGAFGLAEAEARRQHVGFDNVDYTLSSDVVSGAPVWTLQLLDSEQRPVGLLRLSADTGEVLNDQNWAAVPEPERRAPVTRSGEGSGYVQESRPHTALRRDHEDDDDNDDADRHPDEPLVNKAHRYGETVAHFGASVVGKTERAARRVGGWFQKKFTGTDTISPESPDNLDAPPTTSDPYSRPVQPVPTE